MQTAEQKNKTEEITIALAGNPNSGKTTVFNNLTGARQHVGNWPGVTVEKKEAVLTHEGRQLRVVDLPGAYSLSAYSAEEVVTRNYIVGDRPQVVIDVVDASNLERNLYLTIQLIELGGNVLLLLNMTDVSESMGQKLNVKLLSELLGIPVVSAVARTKKGMDELLDAALRFAEGGAPAKKIKISYGREIEEEIEKIEASIVKRGAARGGAPVRWLAVKLLENDKEAVRALSEAPGGAVLAAEAARSRAHIAAIFREDAESVIAGQRYGFIAGLMKETLTRPVVELPTATDRIDRILVNRALGLPIFALFMFLTFTLVFMLGDPPMRWLGFMFGRLGEYFSALLGGTLFGSLVVDGVIGGVGGVVAFLPNIILLFLAIAILEDSGYMARAAFIMDRVMHVMGLHGKSFIPMLVGMGCSVPAVMSTRMLENRKDRLVTILIVPLVSCGARLPVYILLAGAFFPGHLMGWLSAAGLAVFAIYATGILIAVVMARVLRSTLFRGPETPFVMELPPYRTPSVKSILIHTWERAWMYLRKAGTVVLALTVLMWFAMTFPVYQGGKYNTVQRLSAAQRAGSAQAVTAQIEKQAAAEKLEYSFAGRFAGFIEPVMKPIGFNRRTTIAVISGLAAKEVIVTTLGTAYSLGGAGGRNESLRDAIRGDSSFSPLFAVVLMLFTLTSVPCAATIFIIKKETNSWKWPLFSVVYHSALAWVLCFVVYTAGRALGLGG
ncbi:MAG: ferrous iron transport protein B [bacterium]